jgi:hypothetical protein
LPLRRQWFGGAAITVRDLTEGNGVLVRATIVSLFSQSCLVRVPGVMGADILAQVPISELFRPQPTDQAAAAITLVIDRLDRLHDIALRAQAEVYELGGHALR